MLDAVLTRALSQVQQRWRIRSAANAVTAGGAVFALALIVAIAMGGAGRGAAVGVALLAGVIVAVAIMLRTPAMTIVEAARAIEREDRSLDNLLVTAAELTERPRPVHAGMQADIFRLAVERTRAATGTNVGSR